MKELVTLAVSLSLAFVACKSPTGVDRAATAAESIRSMSAALEGAPAKIEAVSASLTELVEGEGDMQALFASFSQNYAALVEHRELIRNLNSRLESNRGAFVTDWEQRTQSIQSEELR